MFVKHVKLVLLLFVLLSFNNYIYCKIGDAGAPIPATLALTTSIDHHVFDIYIRNRDCYKCSLTHVANIDKFSNATIMIDTSYPGYYITVRSDTINSTTICSDLEQVGKTFGENGTYLMNIYNSSETGNFECDISVVVEADDISVPIIVGICLLVVLQAFISLGKLLFKKYKMRKRQIEFTDHLINDSQITVIEPKPKGNRLDSVDTFRGLCLFIMIFVNYGAGNYAILDHSPWNGLHLADLVFPCFIFIMGVSLPLAMNAVTSKSLKPDGTTSLKTSNLLFKIVKRTILLFLFGLIISNQDVTLSQVRIFGVLQRFAVSYFVVAILELHFLHRNGYKYNKVCNESSIKAKFKEFSFYSLQWTVILLFTILWLCLTFLLIIDGCPTGYLGPGGLAENSSYYNCTGGSAALIDRVILGESHVYQSPTCRHLYKTVVPHDPEGLLGCLTSCVLTYLGVSAGHILVHYQDPVKRVIRFLVYGIIYGLIAITLCKGTRDDGWIPINKNLWSLSFILTMASISFIFLILSYLFIDIWKLYSGAPFIYPGKNSICIYMCHEIFSSSFPVQFNVKQTHAALLAMHLYGVCLWTLVAAILYYNKIFINL